MGFGGCNSSTWRAFTHGAHAPPPTLPLGQAPHIPPPTLPLRLPDIFQDHDSPDKQYDTAGLNAQGIIDTVLKALRWNDSEVAVRA